MLDETPDQRKWPSVQNGMANVSRISDCTDTGLQGAENAGSKFSKSRPIRSMKLRPFSGRLVIFLLSIRSPSCVLLVSTWVALLNYLDSLRNSAGPLYGTPDLNLHSVLSNPYGDGKP